MNNKKRNQLIGFIMLILMALIFFPYLVTNKSVTMSPTIPLLPTTDSDHQIEIVTESNHAGWMENSPADQSQSLSTPPNDIEISNTESLQTIVDSPNITDKKNYVVQLVALKNKQKIEELIALLRLNNYDVSTSQADNGAIRLLVGNYPTKDQADLVVIDLANLTKLKEPALVITIPSQ